jgi:hypothetical protein
MAKVCVFVWHDVTGQIVAVGRPMGGSKCVPVTGDDNSVLEAELEEKSIAALHQTHVVDVNRKAVIKHGQTAKST